MSSARTPQPRPGRHRGDQPAAHPGLDDAVVARLLHGEPLLPGDLVSTPGAARLARLLTIAAAPAIRDELMHIDTVCAVYASHARKLRHATSVRSGRPSVAMLGLKVAAIVAAATAVGGAALAASAGILPTPLNPHPATTHGRASDRPVPSRPGGSTKPTATAVPGLLPSASASPSASPSATPSPSPQPSTTATAADLAALCAAYQDTSPSQREHVLKTPEFAPLVAAAQGAEKVKAYCAPRATTSRRADVPPATQSSHPTTSAEVTRGPSRPGG